MKKIIPVAMTLLALSYPIKAQAYNEAEEAAKRVITAIEKADSLVEDWAAVELNGLYVRLFDAITEAVEEEGKEKGYQIAEIIYAEDKQYFTLKVEPTVYKVKKGDTLTKIARTKNTTVEELLSLNPEITDPDKIYYGTSLKIK